MIKLGSKVRDTLTGFEGVAVARTEWIYGCARVGVEKEGLDEKGTPVEAQWFDEQRLELVESRPVAVSEASSAVSGGPKADPSRQADPTR